MSWRVPTNYGETNRPDRPIERCIICGFFNSHHSGCHQKPGPGLHSTKPKTPVDTRWKRFLFVIVDNSDSMQGAKIGQVTSALRRLIADTPEHTKVIVRQFANHLKTLVTAPAGKLDLNRLENDLLVNRGRFEIGGKTALYDSLDQTFAEVPYEYLKTGTVKIIVFTDGIDTQSKTETSTAVVKNVKEMLKKENFFFTFVSARSAEDATDDDSELEATSSSIGLVQITDLLKKQCGRNPRCKILNIQDFVQQVRLNSAQSSASNSDKNGRQDSSTESVNPAPKAKTVQNLTVAQRFAVQGLQGNQNWRAQEVKIHDTQVPLDLKLRQSSKNESRRSNSSRSHRAESTEFDFQCLSSKLGWDCVGKK